MADLARLRANVESVRRRVGEACRRAGRDPSGVTIVAVTKYVGAPVVDALIDLGLTDIAENRPIEGAAKLAQVRGRGRWHFVGHLQTNKVAKALRAFEVFHSVDREDLAVAMEKRLEGENKRVAAFVQVNVSGEASKGGIPPGQLVTFVEKLRTECPALDCRGLMTMAPEEPPESVRPLFRRLRELALGCGLRELSMGMTNDFEVAIEEGSTHLRIGSAFFDGIGT